MFETVKEKIVKLTKLVLREAKKRKVSPRTVAREIALKKVRQAMQKRKPLFSS